MEHKGYTPGPWHWGSGWDSKDLPTGAEEHWGRDKYGDMRLWGNQKIIIPIVLDHYEASWDSPISDWSRPIEADRALIADAPRLYEENIQLRRRIEQLEDELNTISEIYLDVR